MAEQRVEFAVEIGRYRFTAEIRPDRVKYFIGIAGDRPEEPVRISREDFIALVQAGAGRG